MKNMKYTSLYCKIFAQVKKTFYICTNSQSNCELVKFFIMKLINRDLRRVIMERE
jgi:hypothetical protein